MLINQIHRYMGGDQKQHEEKVKPGEHYVKYEIMYLYNFIKCPQKSLLTVVSFIRKMVEYRNIYQAHTKFMTVISFREAEREWDHKEGNGGP